MVVFERVVLYNSNKNIKNILIRQYTLNFKLHEAIRTKTETLCLNGKIAFRKVHQSVQFSKTNSSLFDLVKLTNLFGEKIHYMIL